MPPVVLKVDCIRPSLQLTGLGVQGGGVKSQFKSRFTILGSKRTYAEAVGQTGAQGPVRGCGPHCPPAPRKDPTRNEPSEAPAQGGAEISCIRLVCRRGLEIMPPCEQTNKTLKGLTRPNGSNEAPVICSQLTAAVEGELFRRQYRARFALRRRKKGGPLALRKILEDLGRN